MWQPEALASPSATTPYARLADNSPAAFNDFISGYLPELVGMRLLSTDPRRLTCRVPLRQDLMAPHGYLHGGTLVTVADSLCG